MLEAQHSENPFFTMEIVENSFNVTSYVTPESEPSYCLCGQPYNSDIFMIQCDSCKDWFHSTCCNFREWQAIDIDKYHCPRCSPIIGPSIYKTVHNTHRHDYWDLNCSNKPVQTGTPAFIQELCTRHFQIADEILINANGYELDGNYFNTNGFNNPIVINNKKGLDMTMPPENFSYIDVLKLVGEDKEIDVIDVRRQSIIKMCLGDFVQYVLNNRRNRIFNVVSLEFSNTGMTHIIEPPLIARKSDWANLFWPENYPGKPQVQKYCLMSVKDSYTDFHIDFGGTSVWYHVLKGEKIFFFVKPTSANLTLYSQWMTASNQSETFFGDQVDRCYKFNLRQGQTMLIPTGWIHAVYTPVDSLVFGGNFLHSYNINMQLNCYEIERKTKTETKYLYPSFVTINFFAATKLLEEIIKINSTKDRRAPENLLVGLKALQQAIKHWNNEKDFPVTVKDQISVGTNVTKLLKDIGKEIRHAERVINTLDPPKPERESKRKRKKPINKDFVDYSLSPKTFNNDYMPLPTSQINSPPSYSQSTASSNNMPGIKLIIPKLNNKEYPNTHRKKLKILPPIMEKTTATTTTELWNIPFKRPEETVAEYKGGTVLKFKLGSKDLIPPTIVQSKKKIKINKAIEFDDNDDDDDDDIYDFHDDKRDEDCINVTIDEESSKSNNKKIKKKCGIEIKLPSDSKRKKKKSKAAPKLIIVQNEKNGIESHLLSDTASSLLSVPNISNNAATSAASPSTSEAIAGMLSISQNNFSSNNNNNKKNNNKKRYAARGSVEDEEEEEEEEEVKRVHQDEDYIYPSLDNSDDEDIRIFKPRGRTKVDEAWNPKARVGPLLPKMNRPAREGTKKQAVEKVLQAAAAARRSADFSNNLSSPGTGAGGNNNNNKRQYRRKKLKKPNNNKSNNKELKSLLSSSSSSSTTTTTTTTQLLLTTNNDDDDEIPSCSSTTTTINNVSVPVSASSGTTSSSSSSSQQGGQTPPKPRKGMKTVKQRLGKILKIHKLFH